MENQAKYDAEKFLEGLARRAKELGVKIFENTEVTEISEGSPLLVKTKNGHIVTATDIIVATYNPFNHPRSTRLKKGFYTSYVETIEISNNSLVEAIYWDMSNPYFYFRVDKKEGKTILTLGGADHRKAIPMPKEKNFQALQDHFKKVLPNVDYKIKDKWTGPILEPSDGLALIGQYLPHQYLASAFSGNGMTYSAISGILLSDLILEEENEWASIYDPKRPYNIKRYAKKGKDYVEEFLGGALKNYFK